MKTRTSIWLLATLLVFGVAFKWPLIIKYLTIIISIISIVLSITAIYKILKNKDDDNK